MPKIPFFIGVLYPAKRLLWQRGGKVASDTVAVATKIAGEPEFWEGMDLQLDADPVAAQVGRVTGRLIEVLAADDSPHKETLASVLLHAFLGLSSTKFVWLHVRDYEPIEVPSGKHLEAGFTIQSHELSAQTTRAAQHEFLNITEVGLAASGIWCLQEHEERRLMEGSP